MIPGRVRESDALPNHGVGEDIATGSNKAPATGVTAPPTRHALHPLGNGTEPGYTP